MPHVRIGYPHRAKDGTRRVQGEVVYLSSVEARMVVADGKGKVVTLSPEETVKLAREQAKAKAEAERKAKPAPAAREQAKDKPKDEAPKEESKPKAPARKAPADG